MFEVSARKSNEGTGIGDSEFVISLTTSLEQTPLELSDKPSKASRRDVCEFQFIFYISLGRKGI